MGANISGWVILDKDSGMFSRTAGGRVARLFGVKKFGHIGTLDPMASGVLPIALGGATKMIPYLEEREDATPKEYLFSMIFGPETTTLDITGVPVRVGGRTPDEDTVRAALPRFVGDFMQTPPAFSAVHVDGARAYDLARRGIDVAVPPRRVYIDRLEYTGRNGNSWCFRVTCSRGTYVRSLARDIAAQCGTIATVDMIRRVRGGIFDIKNAVKLDFLESLVNNGGDIRQYLMSADYGLADIPVLVLPGAAAERYAIGASVKTEQSTVQNGVVRVHRDGEFIGLGTVRDGVLMPKRIL